MKYMRHGWIYVATRCSNYGLKQSRKLSNDLLRNRPKNENYYKTNTTPGVWQHTWRPIHFYLVVDGFGVEYVGE